MKMSGRRIPTTRNSKCTVPKEKVCLRHLRNSKVANTTKQKNRKGKITGSESREIMGIVG